MSRTATRTAGRPVKFAFQFEEQTSDELVIPDAEGLAALSADEVTALHGRAVEAFTALHGQGSWSDEELATLAALADGIEALAGRVAEIESEAAARAEQVAALAARIGAGDDAADEDEESTDEDENTEDEEENTDEDENAADTLTASAPRQALRVNVAGLRSSRPAAGSSTVGASLLASSRGVGFAQGDAITVEQAATLIDSRLRSLNADQFATAQRNGVHRRQQESVFAVTKNFGDGLLVEGDSSAEVEKAFDLAADQSNMRATKVGGSLVASGGWCAPSETSYDLFEIESRDGLYSLPEVGIKRGGLQYTPGPAFAGIFADATGFLYTEQNDIDGEYGVDANGVGNGTEGDKPCIEIPCPEFIEKRLDVEGICVTAGLLQRQGYPEAIARYIRGVMVAHAHRVAARDIAEVAAGSTSVTMAANQVGAAAPILTAIELQVEHYRDTHRLSRSVVLEAVFPFWVRGAIRTDLSRRLGLAEFDVSDARIQQWFAQRGIAPQFVYNWQGVSGTAVGSFTAWPTQVEFLLYAAGTWAKGTAPVITMDTLFDSQMLGQNNYTALFTEEGRLIAKRGHDSRRVIVPISADGGTHGGVDIAHNGSLVPIV